MRHFGWDLPPGVTNQMIEDEFGDEEMIDDTNHFAREDEGDEWEEFEETGLTEADCEFGCRIEIDGKCPHGRRSILGKELGI